tara:strand:+ start:45 stop:599 length:555 start_codon:yes stop_codon:yes gene_type:complete
MDIIISKTHSKTDLIELINTINLPVVFGMSDNKRSIQHKLLKSLEEDIFYKPNVYKISTTQELIAYLTIKNPKRTLSVKEKRNIMKICKAIVIFCKCKYILQSQNYYKDLKQIEDDMLYISQFGDLPSVRRACKLMNENVMSKVKYEPLISPQIRKELDEKLKLKRTTDYCCQIKRGPFILYFS